MPRIDETVQQKIIEALQSGMTIRGAAREFRVARRTIENYKKLGPRSCRPQKRADIPDYQTPLTPERLRCLLSYDQGTGLFTWLIDRGNGACAGQRAGTVDRNSGYVLVQIDGRQYRAHRLAWLYVHGRWPRPLIDHIDRNRANNRISNLREATSAINNSNTGRWRSRSHG